MDFFNKKYQIFISSTYVDLIQAREEVIKVILGLYQIPIGMEMFSADNDEQWSVIESTITTSDYYLLILGHRYGSVTKENISYTEKEFDYAKSLGIPILAFVRYRDTATTPHERESDLEKIQMLDRFVQKVQSNAMCDFWKTGDDLGQKVAIALTKIFFKTPRIGWVRGNNATSPETATELATLSQENRELREELAKVKSLTQVEKPTIEVSINKEILTLNWREERFLEYVEVTDHLITDELLSIVPQTEIDTFNNSLEIKKQEIAEYKKLRNEYVNIKNHQKELIVEISNVGQAIATDVYVDIIFPSEIKLFEKDTKFVVPKRPDVPESPMNIMAKAKLNPMQSRMPTWGNNISPISDFSSMLSPINLNRIAWVDLESNTLTIKLSKLTHTRKRSIEENLFIAPLQKGTYEITIKVICDQYAKDETLQIPVTVN